jgi:succinate dehydrogenase / fumarate reductase flavoprotein subunit
MSGHAVVLATGGYGNVFYLSTNAKNSNVTAAWRASKRGAYFANPCYTQIHPTCIPASDDFQSKLTLMSESLRNDGRIWVPQQLDDPRSPDTIPEAERDYFLERRYPAFGNLVPRDVASRAIKREVDAARGVGPLKNGAYLDLSSIMAQAPRDRRALRQPLRHPQTSPEDPYVVPMGSSITTRGRVAVGPDLMSNVPGLFDSARRTADQGAPAGSASASCKGSPRILRDLTIGGYLAAAREQPVRRQPVQDAERGRRAGARCWPSTATVDDIHRGRPSCCGTTAAWLAASRAARRCPRSAIREFWKNVRARRERDAIRHSEGRRVADFEFGD